MNTSNTSQRWVYLALSPLLVLMMIAFATANADAAPAKAKRIAPRTTIVQNTVGKKLSQVQNTKKKNNNKKATAKKHKKHHHHAKKHHKKHRRHHAHHRGGNLSNLMAQIRRDESRLIADINRLKKLLR